MKLESQVCSLDLAKRLKELGVKTKSLWVWEFVDGVPSNLNAASCSGSNVYAYSVAELGEMLPQTIHTTIDRWFCSWHEPQGWQCAYIETNGAGDWGLVEASTEADARAKMLIYLNENKLITL